MPPVSRRTTDIRQVERRVGGVAVARGAAHLRASVKMMEASTLIAVITAIAFRSKKL
jgi:hypothetical protein